MKAPSKKRKKDMDKLWADVIKARAGYMSEISLQEGILAGHHIFGKPNLVLRYDIRNGICLLNHSEHIYGVHNKNDLIKRTYYEDEIRALRESDYFALEQLYHVTSPQFDWDAKEKELRVLLVKYNGLI